MEFHGNISRRQNFMLVTHYPKIEHIGFKKRKEKFHGLSFFDFGSILPEVVLDDLLMVKLYALYDFWFCQEA